MSRPFAESCEQNREPILSVLREWLPGRSRLLEIGSGTGQHAVYFAPDFPTLSWQTSERPEHLAGIRAWLDEFGLSNTPAPLELDVLEGVWPVAGFDAVFSANTAHIMYEPAVTAMFRGVGKSLLPGGVFLLYGPFNYNGNYSSESNARFDAWLRNGDPGRGIRDFEWLDGLARENGMQLAADIEMPVNNRTLVWAKSSRG